MSDLFVQPCPAPIPARPLIRTANSAWWFLAALLGVLASACSNLTPPEAEEVAEYTSLVSAPDAPAAPAPDPSAVPAASSEDAIRPGVFLPNQWTLRPAGESIPLGDFPIGMALSPNGRFAAIVHAGYGAHEVRIINLDERREVDSKKSKSLWHGCVFSPDGRHLYVSAGSDDDILRFEVSPDGTLSQRQALALRANDPKDKKAKEKKVEKKNAWFPGGLAMDPSGRFLYVAAQNANRLLRIDLDNPKNSVKTVVHFQEKSACPYSVVLHPSGGVAYVSLWGAKAVAEVKLADGAVRMIPADSHPCHLVLSRDGSRLFVACANTNLVDVIDTASGRVAERLTTSLYPNMPAGSTPNAVAIDSREHRLLAANADNNMLAVFDIEKPGQTRPLGFIPTGWYPTAVAFGRGGTILAANGKGNSSMANPLGPNPYRRGKKKLGIGSYEYIGGILLGTLSFIAEPDAAELAVLTRDAYACSPLRPDLQPVPAPREEGNPIPDRVGDPSPIKYVVYVIKENRSYDQVLGDMPEGNGDSSLCLFGEEVTPNHHAIAREFTLLDNFYVESEVSMDGHCWTMGAYATDYIEKGWPSSYGGHAASPLAREAANDISNADDGYIWDRAKEAGITYRSYGEWVNGAGPDCRGKTNSAALRGHFNPCYAGFDMNISDLDRLKIFEAEFDMFEQSGDLPRLMIVRLPNDHTAGTAKGKLTPRSYVAQNDLALGRFLERLSRSRFWPEMAVFIVEDDAQNGPDHVDAHRTVALVAGPHVRRGFVDHTMYSTASMLRTMELILGLRPMSQFDAAARPMYACFAAQPDARPYESRPARWPLDERNGEGAPMQEESSRLDFGKEDANPDVAFNQIIWKAVRGADSEMPAPVRAGFIRPLQDADDDD